MRLREGHFERWLVLWRETVDELFAGERAELAKAHAQRVARAFLGRLEAIGVEPPSGGLTITRHGPADEAARRRPRPAASSRSRARRCGRAHVVRRQRAEVAAEQPCTRPATTRSALTD